VTDWGIPFLCPDRLGPNVPPETRARVHAALALISEREDRYVQRGLPIPIRDERGVTSPGL